MSDLHSQLRDYVESTIERVDVDDVVATASDGRIADRRPVRGFRPVWAAAGTALLVLLLVGVPLLLFSGGVSTTVDHTTTTVSVAALPVVVEPGEDILATTMAKETPPIATCPAGSNPNLPGPVDQARPLQDYGFLTAMDRHSGRVIAGVYGGVDTWAFDVCTNTWTRATRRHSYPEAKPSALVYDADSDLVVAVGAFVDAYDIDTDTWQRLGETPFGTGSNARAVYDPVSGLIVARDIASSEMWAYNVDTDTWTPIRQGPISPPGTSQAIDSDGDQHFYAQLHAYDANTDRIVLYLADNFGGSGVWDGSGDEMTWTYDLRAGEWTIEETVTPELGVGAYSSPPGKAAYDEAAQLTVITGDGVVAGYDSTRHEWEILWENPPSERAGNGGMSTGLHNRFGDTIVYDPTNDRIIVIGGDARMPNADEFWSLEWVSMNDVWAFNTDTGTLSELLAPPTP